MSDEAKITKLVIDLGNSKTVEMTVEQAERLYAALDKMFGEKVVERHVYHEKPYWYPRYWLSSSATPEWQHGSNLSAKLSPNNSTLMLSAK